MNLAIINGPNLNMLGTREKEIYGKVSFPEIINRLRNHYSDINIDYYQSNVEGEIVNILQEQVGKCDGIILNAGAYTHTSVAIADAVRSIALPVVEVHISNILAREDYRHTSLLAPACAGSIFGFGIEGYRLAIEYFKQKLF
jgi:3-dehydroquinate dehydratase II